MSEDWLLGGAFGAVLAGVVGYWWRRYPRRAWIWATEGAWFFGGMALSFYLLDRITVDRPGWVALVGLAANVALWVGVLMPVWARRGDRRLLAVDQGRSK